MYVAKTFGEKLVEFNMRYRDLSLEFEIRVWSLRLEFEI
jgi:hypothetical protein